MECIFVTISDDSVACVGSTIEASANIEVLCKNIDQLAFTLITPLGAKDDGESGVRATLAALSSLNQGFLETHFCQILLYLIQNFAPT